MRVAATGIAIAISLALFSGTAVCHEVKDLKYGAVLFEFYQQKYFETLVEYDYAAERGGIDNHGNYPELLKGGVSLSYGLDKQARNIFTRLIEENTTEAVKNRAWFYLAKMLYLRGDIEQSATTLSNIHGAMQSDIDQEYRYFAALVNVRMGYFDEAEAISASFDKDGPYAPYLYFNLGVSFGKEGGTARAVTSLKKAASYRDGSSQLERLADRSNMAIAYLYAQDKGFPDAYEHIRQVNTTGVYSNRALLGAGWASLNSESYREALAPLTVLEKRSMAIPEVQEAVLLVPHIYEKQGLEGRAAQGFITAYDRYSNALTHLDKARVSLEDADVLELFVRNMDDMLEESDWFGTAPSVSLNSLSPFLLDLISDHSFQSVLKDLRDLYAIRNNLNSWKRKRDDFDVIISSRAASPGSSRRVRDMGVHSDRQVELQDSYNALMQRVEGLNAEDRERVQWLLDDIRSGIDSTALLVELLRAGPGISGDISDYAALVNAGMDSVDDELVKTNALIEKVELVMLDLINAELDIHEQRLKYYRVQSHLAKARILDKSLAALDDVETDGQNDAVKARKTSVAPADGKAEVQGVPDAP
jgi:tetratricopeptide (TPR) repeat protein